jgi:3alpha(or 20beta)-hydroxysteroid dehydrogenase
MRARAAGYEGEVKSTTDYPLDVFDRVMAVNVRGVFLGLKYVLPIIQAQRSGAVINTGSTGSHAAAMVMFLASDYARHMIGQYVIVDGGRLAM